MAISHVELHTPEVLDLGMLQRTFPSVGIVRTPRARVREGVVSAESWRDDAFDFWAFDRMLDALAARHAPLAITAERDALAICREVLTRAQRLVRRRTSITDTSWFHRVLEVHANLHDLAKPLVRADHDHAIDAWQWALRLDPAAPPEVQLAALCHDLERLDSEPDVRIAPDDQQFKDAHARASAERAATLFGRAGVPRPIARLAEAAIARHEHARTDPVADADALSFFSFNSPGYLRYFGAEVTAKKVEYSYGRLSSRARRELPALRLPAGIADQLAELDRTGRNGSNR